MADSSRPLHMFVGILQSQTYASSAVLTYYSRTSRCSPAGSRKQLIPGFLHFCKHHQDAREKSGFYACHSYIRYKHQMGDGRLWPGRRFIMQACNVALRHCCFVQKNDSFLIEANIFFWGKSCGALYWLLNKFALFTRLSRIKSGVHQPKYNFLLLTTLL